MSDWAEGHIGDLATGIRGVAYRPDQLREASDESTVTLLRANNIQSGALHFNDVQFVADVAVSEAQMLIPGDIAVCMSNGSRALVGKAAQYKSSNRERTTVGAFCSLFRPASSAAPGYVSYLFQSQAYRAHLDLILAGSAINNLRNKDIEALKLLIAPKREQSAIARILDTLDTQIEKTQALIAKLEQVKEGLLHDLLTRGVDENGELRPSAEEAPELYKESALGLIPSGWNVLTLCDATSDPICYGIVQVGTHVNDGVPVLAIKDLLGDFATGIHRADPAVDRPYARSRVRPGDVLLSIKGTIGRVGVVPDHFAGNISRDIARLRPAPDVRSGYLCHFLRSADGKRTLTAAQVGTTRAELSIGPLKRICIPVPPLKEQDALHAALAPYIESIAKENDVLTMLQRIKSGLMDDLLTGHVRVTTLLDREPAEAN